MRIRSKNRSAVADLGAAAANALFVPRSVTSPSIRFRYCGECQQCGLRLRHRSQSSDGGFWGRFIRNSNSLSHGFGALVKRALNSSSDRRKPSFVSTTDFALPSGSRMSPFSCSRPSTFQSWPFQARRRSWSVSQSSARTASSTLSSLISIFIGNGSYLGLVKLQCSIWPERSGTALGRPRRTHMFSQC